jgi:hypothetical protein
VKNRIDFIVGGIQKCGTTALYMLLEQHPQLIGSNPKEPHFFARHVDPRLTTEDIEAYHSTSFKNVERFESDKLYFEASPDTCFLFHRGRRSLLDPLTRVKLYNPDIKIVVLFRDPVERFYSEWAMRRRARDNGKRWGTDSDFFEFFTSAMNSWNVFGFDEYLYHGCYGSIVLRLLKLFDKESLLFLNPVDMNDSLVLIEQFLDILPHDYQKFGTSPARYGRDQLPDTCARQLTAFYESEMKSFAALTGLDVSRWLDGRT